jgi:3-deoxy-D-manno-octulosonate 8-phosphate phosphatase (KDO 8-P phosphatase)
VGLAIRVADSHPSLISVALYATKAKGGRGAVRELCDLVRKVRDEKK